MNKDYSGLAKQLRGILESDFSVSDLSLNTEESCLRIHDDADGTFDGVIEVNIIGNTDIAIRTIKENRGYLRFRGGAGGGKSPYVLNALKILAFAMEIDNDINPQWQLKTSKKITIIAE